MIDTSQSQGQEVATEDYTDPIVQLFLEDFAVTALLRHGRALKTTELVAAAEGLSLSRTAIHDALDSSTRLVQQEREWNLALRTSRSHMSREERDRQPIEAAIADILLAIAKPLPLPVIVRELTFLRSALVPNLKEVVAGVLGRVRWAIETAPSTYMHESLLLDASAPTQELVVRFNGLEDDPDFEDLDSLELPSPIGNATQDTLELVHTADRPLTHKQIGFLVWKQSPEQYSMQTTAKVVGDRTAFYTFVGGWIAPLDMVAALRNYVQAWAEEHSGNSAVTIDVAGLLRQRNAFNAVPARLIPNTVIEELKEMSRHNSGQPVSLAVVMTDVLDIDLEDPTFVPTIQALNDKLRGDSDFLPVGIGKYLLREVVPPHVGQVAAELRPVQVAVNNPETHEPFDFEMSDEGLEGDAVEFVHSPVWDDLGEEAEVKWSRSASDADTGVRVAILNHHRRAGVVKLRRMDEEFFGVQGAFTRLGIWTDSGEALEVWASRDSGLLYGLSEWCAPRTPPSGGVLVFAHDGQNFRVKVDEPDELALVDEQRARELEAMREPAKYMSLFELLQNIIRDHPGMALPTIWAQVNVVRRTSKRLLCSVLSGYHCFYFKQRGPEEFVWRYDAEKLDQGFKRNKRKAIRR